MTILTHKDFFPEHILEDLFFRDFFSKSFFVSLPTVKKIDYPVDIYVDEKSLEINIAVIGLDKSDIKIDINDDVISVSYNKPEVTKEIMKRNRSRVYEGITKKSFGLAWRVIDRFDLTKTDAEIDKGLLRIVIPLAEVKETKKVEVKIK